MAALLHSTAAITTHPIPLKVSEARQDCSHVACGDSLRAAVDCPWLDDQEQCTRDKNVAVEFDIAPTQKDCAAIIFPLQIFAASLI